MPALVRSRSGYSAHTCICSDQCLNHGHRRMRARKRQDRGAGARSRTVLVSETTLAIELPGNDDLVVRRTTTQAVRCIEGQRPRTATSRS